MQIERGMSAKRPNWNFFNNLLYKIYILWKIASSCIWGPTMQAVLNKWVCRPISPKLHNFKFFLQFLAHNQNSKSIFFMEKNCHLLYLGSHIVGLIFLPKWMWKKLAKMDARRKRYYTVYCPQVTDWQSNRVTESRHWHSINGWGKIFMPIFNKLPYLFRSQDDKAV